jgi:hypothetical protein
MSKRKKLRDAIAAAIKDATSIGGAPNKPCVIGHLSAADAALAALEAAGVRLVEGAASDVLAERERQKSAEGWTPDHDDEHGNGELARAAACYAHAAGLNPSARAFLEDAPDYAGEHMVITRRLWPWDRSWWKPKDRRRDLVRAGALIIAEIERLDRATNKDTQDQ